MSKGTEAPVAAYDDFKAAVYDINEKDWQRFDHLTSVNLNEEECEMAAKPDQTAPQAHDCLAVHWHPEWAPLDLIARRLAHSFPMADNSLIIPTQHNRILTFGPWAGVEADVYDRNCKMKVQLLLHFSASRLPQASVLSAMMERTYLYRAHQLLDILKRLSEADEVMEKTAASMRSSIGRQAMDMARFYAMRLHRMIADSGIIGGDRDEMLKNRLLPDFIAASEPDKSLVAQTAVFINAVKKTVKSELNPDAFHSPQEVIEETRALGGGVVIPHPPQFWPALLADYDIDGWEVWNPSTPRHTVFLAEALNRANESRGKRRRLLAFMGDDTHMSAKFRLHLSAEKDSADREIGFQPPWEDPKVAEVLRDGGQSLANTINEYRSRME